MEQIFSKNFLPERHTEQLLTADLAEIIDEMIVTFQIEFRDVFSKYRSFFTTQSAGFQTWMDSDLVAKLQDTEKPVYLGKNAVNSESIVNTINEFGYDYIYDLLINYRYDDDQKYHYMEQAKAFLNVIHLLKGHKIGLLLVVGLLGITAYTEEWWELVDAEAQLLIDSDPTKTWPEARDEVMAYDPPIAEPDTYRLVITDGIPSSELIAELKEFSRDYVYPLVEIVVSQLVVFDDPIVWTGAMGCCEGRFTSADKRVSEDGYVYAGAMGCCIGYFVNT